MKQKGNENPDIIVTDQQSENEGELIIMTGGALDLVKNQDVFNAIDFDGFAAAIANNTTKKVVELTSTYLELEVGQTEVPFILVGGTTPVTIQKKDQNLVPIEGEYETLNAATLYDPTTRASFVTFSAKIVGAAEYLAAQKTKSAACFITRFPDIKRGMKTLHNYSVFLVNYEK